MPAPAPTNLKRLLFATDYPIDKVVWMRTFTLSVPAFGSQSSVVAHGLPFTPLVHGQWSLFSDFSVAYDVGTGPSLANGVARTGTSAYSNGTNVYVGADDFEVVAKTVYMRVWGLAPAGASGDAPTTRSSAVERFAIHTSYNYPKLYSTGTTPFALTGSDTIPHNLGYRPQVLSWIEWSDGFVESLNSFMSTDSTFGGASDIYSVGTTSMTFTRNPGAVTTSKCHYRIYVDDQA